MCVLTSSTRRDGLICAWNGRCLCTWRLWMCVMLLVGESTQTIVRCGAVTESAYAHEEHHPEGGSSKEKTDYDYAYMENEEEPMQLIYPSEDHSILLLNATNMKYLSEIDRPVAVVSVVGPLHSGKSFLMNQLLNRTNGFELGPTTTPKTRGLWMWKRPIKIGRKEEGVALGDESRRRSTVSDAENKDYYYLLLLDSEGLYASRVSEIYDAKIFAISTLLSSYLIYNSVKFVDQASIDALRLLVKRSHLFELRMELKERIGEEKEEAYLGWLREGEKSLKMPKLLWVVQDFVQMMEGNQSPKDWLKSMLTVNREDEEDAEQPFDQVFRDVDCYTLFLPQYEKQKLVRLDLVEPEELLGEYRDEVEKLRKKVVEEAPIKVDEEGECDGARLGWWLQRLVAAANRGMFPEVPSVWTSFQRLQKEKAIEDATQYFEHELRKEVVGRREEGARRVMSRREMREIVTRLKKESEVILERMVYGLVEEEIGKCFSDSDNVFPPSEQRAHASDDDDDDDNDDDKMAAASSMTLTQKLELKLNWLIDTYWRLNENYIVQYCEECYRTTVRNLVVKRGALALPTNLRGLEERRREWHQDEIDFYKDAVQVYLEESEMACAEYEVELGKRIEDEWRSVWEENLQKLNVELKGKLEALEEKERRLLEQEIKKKVEEQEKKNNRFYQKNKNQVTTRKSVKSILPLEGGGRRNGGTPVGSNHFPLCQQLQQTVPWSQSLIGSSAEKLQPLLLSQPSEDSLKYPPHLVLPPSTLSDLFSHFEQDALDQWTRDVVNYYSLDCHSDFKTQWDSKLSHALAQLFHQFKVHQGELLSVILDEQLLYFTQWLSNLLDQHIALPQPKHQLHAHVSFLYDQLILRYDQNLIHLLQLDAVLAGKARLYLAFKDELAELERRNERKLDFILSIVLPTFKDEIEQSVLSYWTPQGAVHFAKAQVINRLKQREHIVNDHIARELADRFVQKHLAVPLRKIRNRLILLLGFAATSLIVFVIGVKLNRL